MGWEVVLHIEVDRWFERLCEADPDCADQVEDAIDVLADVGPALGRPMVDHIKGSRYHNMKELRPGSSGRSEIRILFAFDPLRRVILLVAGDKSRDWRGWYDHNIPLADRRYAAHLADMVNETR